MPEFSWGGRPSIWVHKAAMDVRTRIDGGQNMGLFLAPLRLSRKKSISISGHIPPSLGRCDVGAPYPPEKFQFREPRWPLGNLKKEILGGWNAVNFTGNRGHKNRKTVTKLVKIQWIWMKI